MDKHTGKRGTYVCYFPVSDAVKLIKMEDNTKAELRKEFKSIYFYNYGKNVFCGDKYIIVFENGDHHDAIIFEPDEKLIALIRDDMDRYKADADAD